MLRPLLVRALACLLAFAPLAATAASADAASSQISDERISALIKKTIAENPEIIIDALKVYQEKKRVTDAAEAPKKIAANSKSIFDTPGSPALGNPKGDITIAVFYDYHCGFCKRFYPVISRLIEEDKNLRVVFKEFPILSEDSVFASRAALAVYNIAPDKYFGYHSVLMKHNGNFGPENLAAFAQQAGIEVAAYEKALGDPAINAELQDVKNLAEKLNVTGTPMIVLPGEMIPGAIDYDSLKMKIAHARDKAKKK